MRRLISPNVMLAAALALWGWTDLAGIMLVIGALVAWFDVIQRDARDD